MRWNLLKEVIEVHRGLRAVCVADWPQTAVSAQLLLLEMMAQTAGLVMGSVDDFQSDIVFAKVEQAGFTLPKERTEVLRIEAVAEEIRPEGGWFNSTILCLNRTVAGSKILLANAGKLKPENPTSVTFHDFFMNHYNIRTKVTPQGAFS